MKRQGPGAGVHPKRGPRPRETGALAALHSRPFRIYAAGQLAATISLWIQRIVQDWLVFELTGSPAMVGALVLIQFGPTLLLGMWGGVIADRYATGRLLLFTQSGAAVVALLMAVLGLTGGLGVATIFIAVAVLGVLSVVERPAQQVFVGELVDAARLPNAISMNSTIFQTGSMLGPAVGGLMIPLGPGWAFGTAALLSAGNVLALKQIAARAEARHAAPKAKGQIAEALRYCVQRPPIFWTLLLLCFVSLIGLNWPVLLTSMAEAAGAGGVGYGLYTSALGAGALIGALLALRRSVVRLRSVYLATVGFMIFKLIAAFVGNQWIFVSLIAAAAACSILMWTAANTTLQQSSERYIRGRVMSLYILIAIGGQALGGPLLGWVIELTGPQGAMALSAGIPLAAALSIGSLALLWQRRARHQASAEAQGKGI
ncbi:MFS transporter [Glutamicibacter endophyticus]|uniref:MFS transporter n=1 Tax=Glutamicibacter endophyticus TaxID=1522174 RepID=UPI003AEF7E7D